MVESDKSMMIIITYSITSNNNGLGTYLNNDMKPNPFNTWIKYTILQIFLMKIRGSRQPFKHTDFQPLKVLSQQNIGIWHIREYKEY